MVSNSSIVLNIFSPFYSTVEAFDHLFVITIIMMNFSPHMASIKWPHTSLHLDCFT
jgi:hypothetical protein